MSSSTQTAEPELLEKILTWVPQQRPFRFVDEVLELSEDHCVGTYTFKEDEFFYAGHFPGNPVTPGVILIETMAQTTLVPLGIFLDIVGGLEKPTTIFFSDVSVDFMAIVKPGDRVTVRAKKEFYRRRKMKAHCVMTLDDGTVAAEGYLSGVAVDG